MKIHFDNVDLRSRSGPNTFASRLAAELTEMGHDVVVNDGRASDVSLVFIERSGRPLAPRVVQRLDGIWAKPSEMKTHNVNIRLLYDVADAVVFQSEFDKTFITRHWSAPKRDAVILNGIKRPTAKLSVPESARAVLAQYDLTFVCSANWHRSKRLKETIELFFAYKNVYPNSCLIVMGSAPDHIVSHNDVFYTGSLDHSACMQVFSCADWMIHVAYFEHCPNSVVEALSMGVPVIHTNIGGTRELVKGFGVEMLEPRPFDFEPTDYDDPPSLDIVAGELPKIEDLSSCYDVSIERAAQQYIRLFESVL